MHQGGAYGQRLGDRLRVDDAPVLITRALKKTEIAVTDLRSDNPQHGMSDPIPYEDAYLVALQLRDYPLHEHWEDSRMAILASYKAGETTFYDLKRAPAFMVNAPFHSIHFYLSRQALNSLANEANARQVEELDYKPGVAVRDEAIRQLGGSILTAFEHPDQVSQLFMDHVTLAVAVYVAHKYGGMETISRPVQGGLAPWQEKRAKEILAANLDGAVALAQIARECNLSAGHFSRAFRRSAGVAPHRWLLQQRVETAQDLLQNSKLTLSELALACGFADQSHFTRVFTREVGISPGTWRRCVID